MYQRQALPDRGDGAVATRAIRAGTCILRSDPVVAVPLDMAITCAYCFAPGARRCGLCKVFHYCSRQCQLADWAVHSAECKYLAKHLHENPITPTLLMAVRFLRNPSAMNAVSHLVSNLQSHLLSQQEDYRTMSMLVMSVLTAIKSSNLPSIEAIMALFAQFNCNAFTLCTLEQVPVGIGMFPDAALLNHSCAPNCILTFHKRQLQIRTIRDVSRGEELTAEPALLSRLLTPFRNCSHPTFLLANALGVLFAPEPPDLTATLTSDDVDSMELQIDHFLAQADKFEHAHDTRRAVDCRHRALLLAQSIYHPRNAKLTLASETLANLITSSEHASSQTVQDVAVAIESYATVVANQRWLYDSMGLQAFTGLVALKSAQLLLRQAKPATFENALTLARDACRLYVESDSDVKFHTFQ
ncbi:hypothetical protein LEN26_001993 [Aphanomyces euteiches]|nr:hypothetical protein AeMF1_001675 [Aphanomyces euteiches]KAH9146854.1 hypothetical protein LEN26_004908 [Aphanomyces euteiches]KAH9160170.1 hypothetical protein LEN26_001993 [Aphanomyces euteiches]